MCLDFFSEETLCGSIPVNDHLQKATTQSLHFGWSLTEGSTVCRSADRNLVHQGLLPFIPYLITCSRPSPPPRQRKNREREREDLCRGEGAATRRLRKPIRYKVNIALIVLITK